MASNDTVGKVVLSLALSRETTSREHRETLGPSHPGFPACLRNIS